MTDPIKINQWLLPFSWIYGMIVWIRNKLFDWKLLPVEEFSVPVISVGNITVGGTGKTPHIEYLIRLLKPTYKIAVLSRGYKRKTSGFILAGPEDSYRTIGDEPYQLFSKFPDILVAVDARRRRGIKNLLALPAEKKPNVILLDDAFQHRYVLPSLSISLISTERMDYEDYLLPAGRLREPAGNRSRAQMIIVTKCPETYKPLDFRIIAKHLHLFPYQSLFYTSFQYGNLHPIFPNSNTETDILPLTSLTNNAAVIVSGIANPKNFIEKVNQYAIISQYLSYGDHHNFSSKDYEQIVTLYKKMSKEHNTYIIFTEKDRVRITDNPILDEEIKNKMFYLPIEVFFNLEQQSIFNKKIEDHVKNLTRNRILA